MTDPRRWSGSPTTPAAQREFLTGAPPSKYGPAPSIQWIVDPETGCWNWQLYKIKGYGRTTLNGRACWAHKAMYERHVGPVPDDHDVHHKCENPACVNPDHLEALSKVVHLRGHWEGRIKLTQEQIAEVRELGRDQSLRQWEIAERFGITRSMVSTLLNGQSWANKGERFRPVGRVCALPGCDEEVHGRRDKRFCCSNHRGTFNATKARAA